MSSTQDEFDARNPWVTVFHLDGKTYGGTHEEVSEFTDSRIGEFTKSFPKAKTILELAWKVVTRLQCLKSVGFKGVEVLNDDPHNPYGPIINLASRKC